MEKKYLQKRWVTASGVLLHQKTVLLSSRGQIILDLLLHFLPIPDWLQYFLSFYLAFCWVGVAIGLIDFYLNSLVYFCGVGCVFACSSVCSSFYSKFVVSLNVFLLLAPVSIESHRSFSVELCENLH